MLVQCACVVRISVIFSAFAFLLVPVEGLQCYQCTTVMDKNCHDPFHQESITPPDCPTVCVKTMFAGKVERGCMDSDSPLPMTGPGSSGCVSQYIPMKGMKTVCRCSTPRCNGVAGRGRMISLSLMAIVIATLLVM